MRGEFIMTLNEEILAVRAEGEIVNEYINIYNKNIKLVGESPIASIIAFVSKILNFIISTLKAIHRMLDKLFGKNTTSHGGGGGSSQSSTADALEHNMKLGKLQERIIKLAEDNVSVSTKNVGENIDSELNKQAIVSIIEEYRKNPKSIIYLHRSNIKNIPIYKEVWEKASSLPETYKTSLEAVYDGYFDVIVKSHGDVVQPSYIAPSAILDIGVLDDLLDSIEAVMSPGINADGTLKAVDYTDVFNTLNNIMGDVSKCVNTPSDIFVYNRSTNTILAKPIKILTANELKDVRLLSKIYKTVDITPTKEEFVNLLSVVSYDDSKYTDFALEIVSKKAPKTMRGFSTPKQRNDIMGRLKKGMDMCTKIRNNINSTGKVNPNDMSTIIAISNVFVMEFNILTILNDVTTSNIETFAKFMDGQGIKTVFELVILFTALSEKSRES